MERGYPRSEAEQRAQERAILADDIERLRKSPVLQELLDARRGATVNRELIALAMTAGGGKKGEALAHIPMPIERIAVYENLIANGETPQQILEAAQRSLATAETRVAEIGDQLAHDQTYQAFIRAERRLMEMDLEASRPKLTPSEAPRVEDDGFSLPAITPKPMGKAGAWDNSQLSPEVRKLLGMDDAEDAA
jgi:hypothetical protein